MFSIRQACASCGPLARTCPLHRISFASPLHPLSISFVSPSSLRLSPECTRAHTPSPPQWNGPVGMILGGFLYVDLSAKDLGSDGFANKGIDEIVTRIQELENRSGRSLWPTTSGRRRSLTPGDERRTNALAIGDARPGPTHGSSLQLQSRVRRSRANQQAMPTEHTPGHAWSHIDRNELAALRSLTQTRPRRQ